MAAKILVVDDEPEALKLFGYSLHRQGYEVIVAQNGLEALEVIQKQKPDLVVLDIMMPDMDGFEVCRRIRRDPGMKHLPVVMLTAKSETEDKIIGFESGADDFISKPVALAELFARIRVLLARSQPIVKSAAAASAKTGNTIGFLGTKGGVGTSTLAVNTGVTLAGQKFSTVLAELRSSGGTAAEMLKLQAQNHLGLLLSQDVKQLTPQTVQNMLVSHSSGLDVLAAPSANYKEILKSKWDSSRVEALLAGLQGISNYLILDLGVGITLDKAAALQQCNHIILVTEYCPLSFKLSKMTLAALSSLNLGRKQIDVVVNMRSQINATIPVAEMENLIGKSPAVTIPAMTELLLRANLSKEGNPAVSLQPDNPGSKAIVELAQLLSRR